MGIGSLFKKLAGKPPPPTLERAEEAYTQGRHADAAALFRALAESNDTQAKLRLAQLYERGEGVLQNFVEAVRWYKGAAEQGSVPAMGRLGEIYLTGLTAPSTATPAALERIGGQGGEGSLLKRLYPEGLAIAQNLEQAAHWNERAAEAGDAGSQARLGYQFASGLGQPQDRKEAEHWFGAAAAQNHPAGQLGLGMLYAGSYGDTPEHASALRWFEPAAASGNSTAQMCAAMLLLFGEDVPRDEERALATADAGRECRTACGHVPLRGALPPRSRGCAERLGRGDLAAPRRNPRLHPRLAFARAAVPLRTGA